MKFGRNTAAVMPERARAPDCGMKTGSRYRQDRPLSLEKHSDDKRGTDRGPSACHTGAGKAVSFSAAGPVIGRW